MTDGWRTVLECVEKKSNENLFTRIRGYDMFAAGVHFQASCRKKTMYKTPSNWRSVDSKAKLHQDKPERAHEDAFQPGVRQNIGRSCA